MTTLAHTIDFSVPGSRWASTPPERRGLARDGVRLMIADGDNHTIEDRIFSDVVEYLRPDDALVVNTSATVAAALDAHTDQGMSLRLHLASPAGEGLWLVEVRTPRGTGSEPGPNLSPQDLHLPGGAFARLLTPDPRSPRLWIAELQGVGNVLGYLASWGHPVRYLSGEEWPITDYQTVFAEEPGSAEMPSAGRPFTTELVTRLTTKGVTIVPVLLHTGLSSYEGDETPGDERFRVSVAASRLINTRRAAGGRIIAVGTTVVRALETAADSDGTIHPDQGWTDLVVTPERGLTAVDGLLTGWHEPGSTHLQLLEAVTDRELLQTCYHHAVEIGYLWHEFGDALLVTG